MYQRYTQTLHMRNSAVAFSILVMFLGCDTSLQPNDELFALKNPTRSWKIPAKPNMATQPVEVKPSKQEAAMTEQLAFLQTATTETVEDLGNSFSIDPPTLLAERMRPDRSAETSVVISSQRWEEFQISDLTCDLEGVTWQLEPADESTLKRLQAKSGWLLRAQLPAGLKPGKLPDHAINLVAQGVSSDEESVAEERRLGIPLQAKVLRRIAAYGGGIDKAGTIHFGVLPRGVKHERKVMLKVHDEEADIVLAKITTVPEFLEIELEPYGTDEETNGLYQLVVQLPANSPEYVSRGMQLGSIHLEFDHPRIKELTLNVDFVLHGRATSWRIANVD